MDVLREYLPITIFFVVMAQFTYTSIIQRIRIKRIDAQTLVCPKCQATGAKNPKITDMGFMKFTCLSCEKNFVLPLSKGLKIAYTITGLLMLLVLMVLIPMVLSL
jgi:transposase-like protein